MSTKVFFTIDTEEDNWGEYDEPAGTVDNILALPRLQSLFDRYGVKPTYLVNYPVASQEKSIDILSSFLRRDVCELGMHCHPWNTPPISEDINKVNSMMCNLEYELLIEKMTFLHNTIVDNFGTKPVSFRAGRWALSEDVARCLVELGFQVDTSMTPYVDWSPKSGPNFRRSSTKPFYFNPGDIRRPDSAGQLLEVPPTIGYFQKNAWICDILKNGINKSQLSRLPILGILDRLNLLNFHWLSPELADGEEMVKLSRCFVRSGHQFLNVSFHSTSLLPGKSPFVRGEADLTKFFNDIEYFLKYAKNNDFEFLPLSEAPSLVERR